MLQQLHAQREMVHPPIHSSIQPRRALVLPHVRVFPQGRGNLIDLDGAGVTHGVHG